MDRLIVASLACLVLHALTSCVTTRPFVLERSDDLSARPDWATLGEAPSESDGKVRFLGMVEVEGDSSKSAAMNMSDEKALSEPMRSLVEQFLDQNQVGEEIRTDANVGRRIISATRGKRPAMPGLVVVRRYWETVVIPQGALSSDRVELRVYSLAEVPASEYQRAKKEFWNSLQGNSEVREILNEVGRSQREALSK
jgi:hypothetical protein